MSHAHLSRSILDYVFKTMMIDEKWSVRKPHEFTWWGHRLAQRVWTEPFLWPEAPPMVRLHAETALLVNVPNTAESARRLDALNKMASLSAYVWDRQRGRVFCHCSHYVTEENFESHKALIAAAVGLQVADAHAKIAQVEAVRWLFQAEPDSSDHPLNERRSDIDDMLHVIDSMFAPRGRAPSAWGEEDLERILRSEHLPSCVEARSKGGELVAFLADEPGAKPIAFAHINAAAEHPQLGNGALMLLGVGLDFPVDRCIDLAHAWNWAETCGQPHCHGYGAWCSDHEASGLTFVTFLPSAIHRRGLLEMLLLNAAVRTKWVAYQLKALT